MTCDRCKNARLSLRQPSRQSRSSGPFDAPFKHFWGQQQMNERRVTVASGRPVTTADPRKVCNYLMLDRQLDRNHDVWLSRDPPILQEPRYSCVSPQLFESSLSVQEKSARHYPGGLGWADILLVVILISLDWPTWMRRRSENCGESKTEIASAQKDAATPDATRHCRYNCCWNDPDPTVL